MNPAFADDTTVERWAQEPIINNVGAELIPNQVGQGRRALPCPGKEVLTVSLMLRAWNWLHI